MTGTAVPQPSRTSQTVGFEPAYTQVLPQLLGELPDFQRYSNQILRERPGAMTEVPGQRSRTGSASTRIRNSV